MSSSRTMPASAVATVALFLLLATLAPQRAAQDTRKCLQKTNRTDVPSGMKGIFDFIVAYNITENLDGQTCGEGLDYFDNNEEDGTYIYKVNGTTYLVHVKVIDKDGDVFYTFSNNPNRKLYVFTELEGALMILHLCDAERNEQTWIIYQKGMDLEKQAYAKAKELTDDPDKYRLDPNGCL